MGYNVNGLVLLGNFSMVPFVYYWVIFRTDVIADGLNKTLLLWVLFSTI
jgi:hypothetical protein